MNSVYTNIFRSIADMNFQMELLEYFSWDEDVRDEFLNDLTNALNTTSSEADLKTVLCASYSDDVVALVFNFIKSKQDDVQKDQDGGQIEA